MLFQVFFYCRYSCLQLTDHLLHCFQHLLLQFLFVFYYLDVWMLASNEILSDCTSSALFS